MNLEQFLTDIRREFSRLRQLADGAISQVNTEEMFDSLNEEVSNSIAVIMKHLAGNMRSRWRDFLTTDGEKPDRHRDMEFEITQDDDFNNLHKQWETGWQILTNTLETLTPADLSRTITIRGEPLLVSQALLRQLSHYAYHVGQIVFLAKHFTGDAWESLSIPKGKSEDFNRNPGKYLDESEE